MSPLAIDLFCGMGGWTRGLQAAGWDVIGFDIAADLTRDYPGHLVLQDVATISGYPMRGKVDLIVASPPCQEFSYMAMPWKRGKAIASALRGQGEFPEGYRGSRTIEDLTALFRHCFRIAEESQCPVVIENVRGAQPWVGRAAWNYGSFYLWGDIPALMPRVRHRKVEGFNFHQHEKSGKPGGSFQSAAVKVSGCITRLHNSKSNVRREASAQIAMIPFCLARWIGECFFPGTIGTK